MCLDINVRETTEQNHGIGTIDYAESLMIKSDGNVFRGLLQPP
jgi:hypothetical protein